MQDMETTARALVAPGKGILAADESSPTIQKRFKTIQVESTEKNRRDYRAALFSTAGLGEFISGVILFDEIIRQKTADGTPLVEVLRRQGIIPGIKVDNGAKALAHFPDEKVTEGLAAQINAWRAWFADPNASAASPSATRAEPGAELPVER